MTQKPGTTALATETLKAVYASKRPDEAGDPTKPHGASQTEALKRATNAVPAAAPSPKITLVNEAIRRHYNEKIQMSPAQIEAVSSAILSRSPGCNLLVFGLGNDSPLWNAINKDGYTLFIEDIPEWIAKMSAAHPDLNIDKVSYQGTTVASAIADPVTTIQRAKVPDVLLQRVWDVIIIDGPMGYAPNLPGRSLPICWAKQMAKPSTHIFVDDYDRDLERTYADFLFPAARTAGRAVISRAATKLTSAGSMVWIIGASSAFAGR